MEYFSNIRSAALPLLPPHLCSYISPFHNSHYQRYMLLPSTMSLLLSNYINFVSTSTTLLLSPQQHSLYTTTAFYQNLGTKTATTLPISLLDDCHYHLNSTTTTIALRLSPLHHCYHHYYNTVNSTTSALLLSPPLLLQHGY